MTPPRIDTVAGAIALLSAEMDVPARRSHAPTGLRPVLVISQATAAADPDTPIIRSRIDVKCYAPEVDGQDREDAVVDLNAQVYATLHRRRRAEVQVEDETYRLHRAKNIVGEQVLQDPDTHEPYTLDQYELDWLDRPA